MRRVVKNRNMRDMMDTEVRNEEGIYMVVNNYSRKVYIGESKNIQARFKQEIMKARAIQNRTKKTIAEIKYTRIENYIKTVSQTGWEQWTIVTLIKERNTSLGQRLRRERAMMEYFRPRLNTQGMKRIYKNKEFKNIFQNWGNRSKLRFKATHPTKATTYHSSMIGMKMWIELQERKEKDNYKKEKPWTMKAMMTLDRRQSWKEDILKERLKAERGIEEIGEIHIRKKEKSDNKWAEGEWEITIESEITSTSNIMDLPSIIERTIQSLRKIKEPNKVPYKLTRLGIHELFLLYTSIENHVTGTDTQRLKCLINNTIDKRFRIRGLTTFKIRYPYTPTNIQKFLKKLIIKVIEEVNIHMRLKQYLIDKLKLIPEYEREMAENILNNSRWSRTDYDQKNPPECVSPNQKCAEGNHYCERLHKFEPSTTFLQHIGLNMRLMPTKSKIREAMKKNFLKYIKKLYLLSTAKAIKQAARYYGTAKSFDDVFLFTGPKGIIGTLPRKRINYILHMKYKSKTKQAKMKEIRKLISKQGYINPRERFTINEEMQKELYRLGVRAHRRTTPLLFSRFIPFYTTTKRNKELFRANWEGTKILLDKPGIIVIKETELNAREKWIETIALVRRYPIFEQYILLRLRGQTREIDAQTLSFMSLKAVHIIAKWKKNTFMTNENTTRKEEVWLIMVTNDKELLEKAKETMRKMTEKEKGGHQKTRSIEGHIKKNIRNHEELRKELKNLIKEKTEEEIDKYNKEQTMEVGSTVHHNLGDIDIKGNEEYIMNMETEGILTALQVNQMEINKIMEEMDNTIDTTETMKHIREPWIKLVKRVKREGWIISRLDKNRNMISIECPMSYHERLTKATFAHENFLEVNITEKETLSKIETSYKRLGLQKLKKFKKGTLPCSRVDPKDKDMKRSRLITSYYTCSAKRLLMYTSKLMTYMLRRIKEKHFVIHKLHDFMPTLKKRMKNLKFRTPILLSTNKKKIRFTMFQTDIKEMFTNLQHKAIITSIDWIIKKIIEIDHKRRKPETAFYNISKTQPYEVTRGQGNKLDTAITMNLQDLRNIVLYDLENTWSKVGKHILYQKEGCPIGGMLSSNFANIKCAYNEANFMDKEIWPKKTKTLKMFHLIEGFRCIDDVLIIAAYKQEEPQTARRIKEFYLEKDEKGNSIPYDGGLQLEEEEIQREENNMKAKFIGMNLYLNKNGNYKLSTNNKNLLSIANDYQRKPTYPRAETYLSKHILRGTIRSSLIRFSRQNSTEDLLLSTIKTYQKELKILNYDKKTLHKEIEKLSRTELIWERIYNEIKGESNSSPLEEPNY